MNKNHSGYSLAYDPASKSWHVNSWTRLSSLSVHTEAATEDFFSYAEALDALKELDNHV